MKGDFALQGVWGVNFQDDLGISKSSFIFIFPEKALYFVISK